MGCVGVSLWATLTFIERLPFVEAAHEWETVVGGALHFSNAPAGRWAGLQADRKTAINSRTPLTHSVASTLALRVISCIPSVYSVSLPFSELQEVHSASQSPRGSQGYPFTNYPQYLADKKTIA